MDKLLSVGLDVGTTTTQLIVSELTVENKGNSFSVPEMVIGQRKLLYQSPVRFTPLLSGELVDGDAIAQWVAEQYAAAGIGKAQVDTGAVIITGETSRKENAKEVLQALSGFAGDFVVATAGPDLESVLSAKGAGAVDFSAKTGKTVLHMDIGGGTSNLSYIENGRITATGCLNVGGRLVKFHPDRTVSYLSPVLTGLWDLQIDQMPTQAQLQQVADLLVQALEMAAGLRPVTGLLEKLTTKEAVGTWVCRQAEVISFSGGVADCIEGSQEPFVYGDIGPILGKCIKNSCLCQGPYRLGSETIRATVIGAGCHSAQLSGSTVFCKDVALPVKNCPVAVLDADGLAEKLPQELTKFDRQPVIALRMSASPSYREVKELARVLATLPPPIIVALEADAAKALGQAISLLRPDAPCLCIDRVRLQEGDYLDIGKFVGPALPVVVKTLILEK